MADSLPLTKHILVIGLVQGVGFRKFAQRTALSLQITGWVRNLDDGRVEIMATAQREVHETFCAALTQGAGRARVDSLEARVVQAEKSWETFSIHSDGRMPWSENS